MARSLPTQTWRRGFAEPADDADAPWADPSHFTAINGDRSHYHAGPSLETPTSGFQNSFDGQTTLRYWPALYGGTESPGELPKWWKVNNEVDVLICGAGPFGLQVAVNLARQGISFRIIDTADAPCLAGRADGIQPRGLEYLYSWGVGPEASEEGPILNSTVFFRNSVKLFHDSSSQCDSRYKGTHIITQGQLENIYIRDLLRHKILVERCKTILEFQSRDASNASHPVKATLKNSKSGETETVSARYLVGADGAASSIRSALQIPFDGLATNCFWAIMDCKFKTDYPYILGFNILVHEKYGGCIIVPREQGYTRFYCQITGERAAKIAEARKSGRSNSSAVGETQVNEHGITPDEALEHLNKIMDPWKVEYTSPMSWFAVWRVNERVARYFSSPDQRVHIGGDAAHVHSVLGAFGLNSSIYDAANLGWKLGLSIKGAANPKVLLPTYDSERRLFANRVIRVSGSYLRFVCNLNLPLAQLRGLGTNLEAHDEQLPELDGTTEADMEFLSKFFIRNSMFILGVEMPIVNSPLCPEMVSTSDQASTGSIPLSTPAPTSLLNGVRAPNPRICLSKTQTSYLYDLMTGVARFHILIFASDAKELVRGKISEFSNSSLRRGGFWHRFGRRERFNILLVLKALPHEAEELMAGDDITFLRNEATIIYDDRAPDDDAHYWYGINHARGAVVVVRPDLVVGMSAWPENAEAIDEYFSAFLTPTYRPS
ncbi:FAD binding domain-containing protein [Xylaria acuta]|nr:FAD binding domain-containing protein [Xylaria acuta]